MTEGSDNSGESSAQIDRSLILARLRLYWKPWLTKWRQSLYDETAAVLWNLESHIDRAFFDGLTEWHIEKGFFDPRARWEELYFDLLELERHPATETEPPYADIPWQQGWCRERKLRKFIQSQIMAEADKASRRNVGKYDGLNVVSRGVRGLSRRSRPRH